MNIPLWNRLSTRLSLLILIIVLVLAGATAILLSRGFGLAQQDVSKTLSDFGIEPTTSLPDIIRSTVVNLMAVFLLTLVGATVFSRSLLTEPINSLVQATREVAEGNLGVTIPVTSKDELGTLASTFNQMTSSLASRTQELIKVNEALKQSEAQLEQRVQERTSELMALLELSNSIALTVEDLPLIEHIFDELHDITQYQAAGLFELIGTSSFQQIIKRGQLKNEAEPAMLDVLKQKKLLFESSASYHQIIYPISVRDKAVGVLVLELEPERQLSEEKMRLVSTFATQAGVALENTKLYTDVQEKAAFEERQHLARELHDSVSQALYSIVLGSHAARKQLERDPEQASKALEYVQNLAEAGLAEMRALIFELRPEVLEQEGLTAALRKQVEALEVRHGIKAEFEAELEPDIPFTTKQALFRVVQEALHNIVKHAKATRVDVRLSQTDKGVLLCIRDDGIGFNTLQDFTGHLGLKSMQERVASLGGHFKLTSEANAGTHIRVEVPR